MENEERFFETPDPYASSVLTIELKKEPEYVLRRKKVFFRFVKDEGLYQILNRYVSGELQVTAIRFVETLRRLRSEMIRRREAGDADGR